MTTTKEPTEMTYLEHLEEVDAIEREAKETNLRKWYHETYPTDDMYSDIREELSFYDLYDALDNHVEIYDFVGAHDSLIRERLFEKLAKIMKVDYDYIYTQWLGR